jgi:hypothetical protein
VWEKLMDWVHITHLSLIVIKGRAGKWHRKEFHNKDTALQM